MDCEINEGIQISKGINYDDAIQYWTDIPATVDGMLGGFGFISTIDIQGSEHFLKHLFQLKTPPGKDIALDCGAGIGRITKHLLVNFFKKVDLVEPVKTFLDESQSYIDNEQKLGNLYNVGLQDFESPIKYDMIWCQWVLSHLTNDDLVAFYIKCRKMLRPNGVLIVKENMASSEDGDMDDTDSSRTRHESEMKELFVAGGLRIIKETVQKKFPKGLYKVKMFALRPSNVENSVHTNS